MLTPTTPILFSRKHFWHFCSLPVEEKVVVVTDTGVVESPEPEAVEIPDIDLDSLRKVRNHMNIDIVVKVLFLISTGEVNWIRSNFSL